MEVGLGYSAEREHWKMLVGRLWWFAYEKIWKVGFLEIFMYFRAFWVVVKMGAGVSRWFPVARWL